MSSDEELRALAEKPVRKYRIRAAENDGDPGWEYDIYDDGKRGGGCWFPTYAELRAALSEPTTRTTDPEESTR